MNTSTENSKQTEEAPSAVSRYFSSSMALLVPLVVVLLAMTVAYTFQVKSSADQLRQLRVQLIELRKDLPRAQLINTKMLQFSRDLVDLGKSDLLAGQIVREFNIRLDDIPGEKKKPDPS